jgi:hypothetical protein
MPLFLRRAWRNIMGRRHTKPQEDTLKRSNGHPLWPGDSTQNSDDNSKIYL